jgi:hypothetical protein
MPDASSSRSRLDGRSHHPHARLRAARITGAELLLVHMLTVGPPNFDQLKLRESEEMKSDRAYPSIRVDLTRAGSLSRPSSRWGSGDRLIKAAQDRASI